jgi:signal transduction histidine kinase
MQGRACWRSLGSPLLVAPLGLMLVAVALVGWLAYQSTCNLIEQDALRTVGIVANARASTLRMKLQWQHERAREFLHDAVLTCALMDAGRHACLLDRLHGFLKTEDAQGATLAWAGTSTIEAGEAPPLAGMPAPSTGRLAVFDHHELGRSYLVGAESAHGTVLLRFMTATHVDPIFLDHDGLGDAGESFLTDAEGYFVTPPRYPYDSVLSHPIHTHPMRRCLSGEHTQEIAPDYRGAMMIHGYLFVPESGGCIMAHVDHEEAMAPARRLKGGFMSVTAGLVLAITGWAALFRRGFAHPIERLTKRARAFEEGDFASAVPMQGPHAVRTFARAFASMARSIQKSQAELEKAVKAREEFISMASHELRTPLTTLKLRLQSMRRTVELDPGAPCAELERPIGVSCHQTERMSHLVDEMLSIARLHGGRLSLELREVNLAVLAMRVIDDHAEAIARSGSTVALRVEETVVGRWDAFRLEQVCVNLLTNALKYGAGKPITISVVRNRTHAQLTVRDEGIGIAPEDLERIFAPFERTEAARNTGGLGLGLAIAQGIVKAHGGTIRVESAPREGTTFIAELPLDTPAERAAS